MKPLGYEIILLRDCTIAFETPESLNGEWANKITINIVESLWGGTITLEDLKVALKEQGLSYQIYQRPNELVYYYPETLELIPTGEDNMFNQVSTPPSNDIIWNATTFKEIPIRKPQKILGLKEVPGRMLQKMSGLNKWIIKGQSESTSAHLVVMKPRKIGKSAYFIAQGKLHRGGLSLGMVEKDNWALQVHVTMPGDFKIVILVPPGTYNPTLASCLDDSLYNDFEITKIGWVEK